MAHELTIRESGYVEMAYHGETPWHGLGQVIEDGDTIETIRKKAGMDWQIEAAPVEYFAITADGTDHGMQQFDGLRALYRSDTGKPLAVVSERFKIVQPEQVIEFFRELCEANHFKLITAGTMFGGKKFWAQADIGESAYIRDRDQVDGRLLLATSCDGSIATIAKFVNTRVVCNNTITNALNESDCRLVKVSHRSVFDPDAAKKELGIATDSFAQFVVQARKLANKPVSTNTVHNFLEVLLGDSTTKEDVTQTAGYKSIMDLFQHGKGNAGETAWDLVNGVTEYVDHVMRAKTDSNRLDSSWFGRGDKLKSAAFEMACALS